MDTRLAVYWDFESLHGALCGIRRGADWLTQNRFTKQEALADVSAIMEFVVGLGGIDSNKAYADWGAMEVYAAPLQRHSVDLHQQFFSDASPRLGADLRMAFDIVEDITQNPGIDTVVLVGGASEYLPLTQKLKQRGKSVIGIGLKEVAEREWVQACDQFKFYSSLVVKSGSGDEETRSELAIEELDVAKRFLVKAISKLRDDRSERFVPLSALREELLRLDPTFDAGNFGYGSFQELLDACSDVCLLVKGETESLAGLAEEPRSAEPNPKATDAARSQYEAFLSQSQLWLPEPGCLESVVGATYDVFALQGVVSSYDEFKIALTERLTERGSLVSDADLNKVKTILYKLQVFRLNAKKATVRLDPSIKSRDALIDRVLGALIERLGGHFGDQSLDRVALAQLLLGDERRVLELEKFFQNSAEDGRQGGHGSPGDDEYLDEGSRPQSKGLLSRIRGMFGRK